MNRFTYFARRLRDDRRAVTALEYALIAGVMCVAVLIGFNLIGGNLGADFTTIADTLT